MRMIGLLAGVSLSVLGATVPAAAQAEKPAGAIRIATYNASLNRGVAGQLRSDLADRNAAQPRAVAEIIQRVNPDIILINEFDFYADDAAADLFVENFLAVGQNGAEPWTPVAIFAAPSNTGVPSGIDYNRDGNPAGPDDAFGFGLFPGQYGMVILSKFPIAEDEIRTFQNFLWKDMPGAMLPDDPATPAPADYYSPEALAVFRLSSKSHWDVPVETPAGVIHVLASHPTPPVFDGAEDRNGTRNHDEVRFLADYITPGEGAYIVDDEGLAGPLGEEESFVILGDLNLDPNDGDGIRQIGQALLANPRLTNASPASEGGPEAALAQAGKNATHAGDPANDTADFGDTQPWDPGNLRADHVLPSADLTVLGSGIFWPASTDPLAALLMTGEFQTSDHRLVWVDIAAE